MHRRFTRELAARAGESQHVLPSLRDFFFYRTGGAKASTDEIIKNTKMTKVLKKGLQGQPGQHTREQKKRQKKKERYRGLQKRLNPFLQLKIEPCFNSVHK